MIVMETGQRSHQPFWNQEILLGYRLMRRATCFCCRSPVLGWSSSFEIQSTGQGFRSLSRKYNSSRDSRQPLRVQLRCRGSEMLTRFPFALRGGEDEQRPPLENCVGMFSRVGWPMLNRFSHGTCLHFDRQSSHSTICYYQGRLISTPRCWSPALDCTND